jgi:hypothetical protein
MDRFGVLIALSIAKRLYLQRSLSVAFDAFGLLRHGFRYEELMLVRGNQCLNRRFMVILKWA